MLPEDLKGWDESMGVGERFKKERIYVYLRQTQHCKAIIFQLNVKKTNKQKTLKTLAQVAASQLRRRNGRSQAI